MGVSTHFLGLSIVASALILPCKSTQAAVQKMTLVAGEIRDLPISPMAKIHISRRGTIEAVANPPHGWQVIALRRGQVTLSTIPTQQDAVADTYLIEVLAKESPRVLTPRPLNSSRANDLSKPDAHISSPLASPICKERTETVCTATSIHWRGAVATASDWHHLAQACPPGGACLLTATWTKNFFNEVQTVIENSGWPARLSYGPRPGAPPIIRAPCLTDGPEQVAAQLDQALGGLLSYLNLAVICHSPHSGPAQHLVLNLTTQQEGQSHQWQGNSSRSLAKLAPEAVTSSALELPDKLRHEQRHRRQIGHVELMMPALVEQHFRLGGDFTSDGRSIDQPAQWQALGITGRLTLSPFDATQQRLIYDLEISQPGASSRAIDRQIIAGERLLRLNEATDLIVAAMTQGESENGDHSWWSRVPIIGPLYRQVADQKRHLTLVVTATWRPSP